MVTKNILLSLRPSQWLLVTKNILLSLRPSQWLLCLQVALPTETTTGKCYLALYVEYLLAMQERSRELTGDDSVQLPLAIMTSDDTHAATLELLESNGYFGLEPSQCTLMKQNKVPAVADNTGMFALGAAEGPPACVFVLSRMCLLSLRWCLPPCHSCTPAP